MLHVAACIRAQGPPANYWCFAMERYGGWVTRWAKSNQKQVITAVPNRIVKQERVSKAFECAITPDYKRDLSQPDPPVIIPLHRRRVGRVR